MKGRILRRRTRARASGAGYTLIELMVVVMLIAILAMLAAPSMVRARSDRLAFSYARQVGELVHNARARSAGRGGAHLVVYSTEWGARGAVLVFEALDGAPAPGPNPTPSCRVPGQWSLVTGWAPGATDPNNRAAIVDALNINATSSADVVVQENITMIANFTASTSADPPVPIKSFALCTSPNGTTYFGKSTTTAADAIKEMQESTAPFSDVVEVDVARHDGIGTVVGLKRRVIMAGAGSPRIKSE